MNQDLYHTVFLTDAGYVGLQGSKAGLRRLILPRPSESEAKELLNDTSSPSPSPHFFNNLTERLKAYFAGSKVEFPDKLDLSNATAFQRDVWQAARLIPYGETRSYGWLARQIGRPEAARAVGQALGRNPVPVIVPCHRVLAGDGGLGGFSGGIEMKEFLLRLEANNNIA